MNKRADRGTTRKPQYRADNHLGDPELRTKKRTVFVLRDLAGCASTMCNDRSRNARQKLILASHQLFLHSAHWLREFSHNTSRIHLL
jgi:hypothetical protein